jgi:tetratricopeptide (TPR) repeat protein
MKRIIISLVLVGFGLSAPADLAADEQIDSRAVVTYLQGVFFESRFDLQAALEFYERADRFERDNPKIQLSLAGVYLEIGDLARARQYASRLVEEDAYRHRAGLILAEVAYRQGNPKEALELLLPLKDSGDDSRFDVLKFLSKVYLDLGEVAGARDALEEAALIFSEDLYLQYRLGVLYYETGEIERAIKAFEKSIEISPGFTSAHHALATLLQHAGRTEEAKRSYRNVLKLDPHNGGALEELVELLFDEGDYTEGIDILEPLRAEGALDSAGELMLGRLYYRAGRIEEALGIFKDLADTVEDATPIMRVIAEIEIQRGHFRTAFAYLERSVDQEPDNFENYIGILLMAYGLAGDAAGPDEELRIPPEEASGYLDAAEGVVGEDSAQDNFFIGAVMRKVKRNEGAERFLLRAEELDPTDRRTLLELATLYESAGRFDEALERVVRLYEMAPDDASINNYYGYLLAEKGERLGFAEELIMKAIAEEPENGYFLDSLGWIRFKQGDFDGALRMLLEAIGRVTDDPVMWEHLGRTYEMLDRNAEALDAYQRSFSIDPEREGVGERIESLEKMAEIPNK